ncbi:MAG: hypothetical protein ACRBBW_16325 [Cellvibrionaceae bacterium]
MQQFNKTTDFTLADQQAAGGAQCPTPQGVALKQEARNWAEALYHNTQAPLPEGLEHIAPLELDEFVHEASQWYRQQ